MKSVGGATLLLDGWHESATEMARDHHKGRSAVHTSYMARLLLPLCGADRAHKGNQSRPEKHGCLQRAYRYGERRGGTRNACSCDTHKSLARGPSARTSRRAPAPAPHLGLRHQAWEENAGRTAFGKDLGNAEVAEASVETVGAIFGAMRSAGAPLCLHTVALQPA